MTPINEPSDYPRQHQALSLYKPGTGEDVGQEFHLQIVEISAAKFNVLIQIGQRGETLSSATALPSPGNLATADAAFTAALATKRSNGFQDIDLSHLGEIYAEMSKRHLDNAGIDLCIERKGKLITLVQYANEAGTAATRGSSQISSYSSARSARDALREMGVAQEVEGGVVLEGLSAISRMLSKAGLDGVGVFVGYTGDDGQIYRGVPPEFQVAARNKRP